jgi:hypothetical protein
MKTTRRKLAEQTAIRGKVTCRGTFGCYEVIGWRYHEDAVWHVRVWPVGRPSEWIGYTVSAGIFELNMVSPAHKEAVLHLIGEWERGVAGT